MTARSNKHSFFYRSISDLRKPPMIAMSTSRSFPQQLRDNWLATIALVVSLISLGWNIRLGITRLPNDPEQILQIMESEAEAAKHHDVKLAVSLYDSNAMIKSINPPMIWKGEAQIRKRYAQLPEFLELGHIGATIIFDQSGTYARVQSGTSGWIKNPEGSKTIISSVKGEEWTFKKIDGDWKILDFTYGIK